MAELYLVKELYTKLDYEQDFSKKKTVRWILYWNTPRRQLFIHFFNTKKNTQVLTSAGQYLSRYLTKPKFYKYTYKGWNNYFVLLKNKLIGIYPQIQLLRIRCFNLKQLIACKRFMDVLKPRIDYLQATRPYRKSSTRHRRLKRYVWLLVKNQ